VYPSTTLLDTFQNRLVWLQILHTAGRIIKRAMLGRVTKGIQHTALGPSGGQVVMCQTCAQHKLLLCQTCVNSQIEKKEKIDDSRQSQCTIQT
jgi:hypothetical protein